jgi:hypothetical protein
MADAVEKPEHNLWLRLHAAQMVLIRVSFALGNLFRTPVKDSSGHGLIHRPAVAAFAGAILGCLTTLYLCAFGIAPGIASALATSLICGQVLIMRAATLLAADFFIAVYGGSFAGMTPVLWLNESGADHRVTLTGVLFISLSVVAGLVFGAMAEIDARAKRRFASGYGGRSGALAALASFLFLASAPLFGADERLFRGLTAEMFELDLMSAALTSAACAVGLFATMILLRWRSVVVASQADRTFLASAVALIGMAALQLNGSSDPHLLDAFYAGCFLGMTAPARLDGWLQPLVGALVLTAMLVLVRIVLPGLGGGLGLAAFVTVMLLVALSGMSSRTKQRALQVHVPRRAGTIAHSVEGLLALGCFVMLLLSASPQPTRYQAASAEAAMQAGPVLPPLALAGSREANDAAPVEGTITSAGSADLAISLELPYDMKMVEHALPERGEHALPELSYAAVLAARDAAAEAAAAPSRAEPLRAETLSAPPSGESQPASLPSPDAPGRAISGDAMPVMAEPQRSQGAADDVAEADEKLFREFLQWRAARGVGIAQGRPQPARIRTHPAQAVGLVTPVTAAQVHAARPRPAASADLTGWPRPARPPRPVRNTAATPAP